MADRDVPRIVRGLRATSTAYGQGFEDGVGEMLDQLEGRSNLAPQGCYRGPMPDELLTWLAVIRRRLERERGGV